jgi:hypothetical protein
MSTLFELRSQLITEIDIDPNSRNFSTPTLNQNINRGVRKVQQDANYALPENRKVFTFTPSSQETNLPADFVKVGAPESVKQGDSTKMFAIDYFELLGLANLTDSSGSSARYYIRKDASQWIVGVYPFGGTDVVTLPYYGKLEEMAVDNDECSLDDTFDDAVVQYAKYLTMRRKKGFEQQAVLALEGYTQAYDDAGGNRIAYNEFDLKVSCQNYPSGWDYNPRGMGYWGL